MASWMPQLQWGLDPRRDVKGKVPVALSEPSLPSVALTAMVTLADPAPVPDVGWPAYGGDTAGPRNSALAQTTPANVGELTEDGHLRTGDLGHESVDCERSVFDATCDFCHEGLNSACTHGGYFGVGTVGGATIATLLPDIPENRFQPARVFD